MTGAPLRQSRAARDAPLSGAVDAPIRVGISACLLGREVRFDGGHKRDAYINGTLSRYFQFVPLCPEAEVGLGVPRQPIRLQRTTAGVRALGAKDPGLDPTDDLDAFGRATAQRLGDLSGFIFKSNSPSCGMERVKIHGEENCPPAREGRGIFAAAFMASLPLVPVEEEGRLGDPELRENFIERVFVYHRWRRLALDLTAPGLVAFHAAHKYQILSHSQRAHDALGRLVANLKGNELATRAPEYVATLMQALAIPAGPEQHLKVLQHLLGYLKDDLDSGDRAELVETFEQYRSRRLPLVVPITLLRHHFRHHPDPDVQRQYYLDPHPRELMLRNRI
ncbi:MAG: DUF523 and DUF1722 domain-containing protein [Pseudomonadota bacterium]